VAFLALLGAMRALRVARPAWQVHAWWSGENPRPVIAVDRADDESAIGMGLVEGLRAHREAFAFPEHDDVKFAPPELRELLRDALARHGLEGRLRVDAVSVLGSDAVSDEKGQIRPTPYCLMFGQGHQHFLKNWSSAPRIDEHAGDRLLAALRDAWPYDEAGLTFRWDPEEDRRYALRARDPSGDKVQTCDAANRLAAIGLASLPAIPTERFLEAPGFVRSRRQAEFRWPLWTVPLRERAIVALLRHPYVRLGQGRPPAGVTDVMAAERRSVGKFLVVTPARRVGAATTDAPLVGVEE
jgi:hypothetical protein